MNDNMDINALLEFSRQQDELIAGHQQQMQQVLDNNRHLRTALERSQAQIVAQQEEIDALRRQVAQLKAERRQLLARPTNIETGRTLHNNPSGSRFSLSRNRKQIKPNKSTNKISYSYE